jgi:hypothetical protein
MPPVPELPGPAPPTGPPGVVEFAGPGMAAPGNCMSLEPFSGVVAPGIVGASGAGTVVWAEAAAPLSTTAKAAARAKGGFIRKLRG